MEGPVIIIAIIMPLVCLLLILTRLRHILFLVISLMMSSLIFAHFSVVSLSPSLPLVVHSCIVQSLLVLSVYYHLSAFIVD
jgi:hypothetical protein